MFRLVILVFLFPQDLSAYGRDCQFNETDTQMDGRCVWKKDCLSESKDSCNDHRYACCPWWYIEPRTIKCGYTSMGNEIKNATPVLPIRQYSWLGSLEYDNAKDSLGICAGSVISPLYVITAAHCLVGEILQKFGQVTGVRLKNIDEDMDYIDEVMTYRSFPVIERIVHPEYRKEEFKVAVNDIGLLKLQYSLYFNGWLNPICLPFRLTEHFNGTLTAGGWNKTLSQNYEHGQRAAHLQVLSDAECIKNNATIEMHICAKADDVHMCDGDSGGPLMRFDQRHMVLEGIISQGFLGCSESPSISTRVRNYMPWIENHVWPDFYSGYKH